jgi:hypothetical protein
MKRLGNREQENASERRSRRRTTRGSERCSGAFDSERERERERERVCGSASSLKALHWIAGKKKKTKKGVDNKEVKNITGVENGMGTLGRIVYSLGVALRETGQALDRLGSRVQGSAAFKEECKHHLCTAVVYMEVEIDLFLFLPLFCLSRLPAEFRGDENPQAGRS